jgi:endonuclease I
MGIPSEAFAAARVRNVGMRHGFLMMAVVAAATMHANISRADYTAPLPAYAPPANYYANATGTGSTLRLNLAAITATNFTGVSYGDSRADLPVIWTDPTNSANMIEVYTHTSIVKPTGGSIPGWEYSNNVLVWNREHIWPQSWLGVSVSNTYVGPASDLFELAPADPTANGGRGNDGYGNATSSGAAGVNGSYFYPGDTDKGDMARSLFYMATRYYTGSSTLSINNLQLVNGSSYVTYQMGDLQSLLTYNYTDGVDNFERARNQTIYTQFQHNRNPFIDHPEYVWAVFGDRANNAQLSVGTPAANGSSASTVDLGRILTGASFSTGTATFTKTGYTPTTFDLTTAGNAVIPNTTANGTAPSGYLIAGVGQGITFNNQTRLISVGLNASTASTGLKSGTITLHNSDLTSAGAGMGSADGDDVISVTGSVLAKRTLTVSSNQINFGTVIVGAAVSQSVSITTTGDDNNATRLNVAGSTSADANGIAIQGAPTLFNAANSAATPSVGGQLTTVGSLAGALSLPVTTAENGGAGLPGEGAYPAINLNYAATVLSHATPSFDPTITTQTLTLTFPTVALNSTSVAQNFSIANLAAAMAAGLDFTGYTLTGSTAFSTTLALFQNESQNTAHTFSATLPTSSLGTFSSTYTLQCSDEQDLLGATAEAPLSLVLTGSVALLGDTNLDGKVDLSDLNAVLNNLGTVTSNWSAGNFDGAPTVDLTDLNDVLNNLGTTAPTGNSLPQPVPEPASLAVLTLLIPTWIARRRPAEKKW